MKSSSFLLVFPLLLTASAFAQLGPEHQVSTPVLGKSPDSQYVSAVASNGEGYLMAFSGLLERVDAEGRVLDPGGFPPHDAFSGGIGAVVSDGEDYLVIWSNNANLYATRVRADGSRGEPHVITEGGESAQLAWNGYQYLLVWKATNGEIQGRFLDREGRPLSAPHPFCRCGDLANVALASNGGEFFIAFTEIVTVAGSVTHVPHVVAVDSDGRINQRRSVRTSGSVRGIHDLEANGDSYALLLLEHNGEQYIAELLLFDDLGFSLREGIRFPAGDDPPPYRALIPYPDGVLMVWSTAEEIVVQRIDMRGEVIDQQPVTIAQVEESSPGRPVEGAWNSGRYLIAWSHSGSYTDFSLFGVLINDSLGGLPAAEAPLHVGAAKQSSPVAASRGDLDVTVWIETREISGPDELRGARISREGASLDGAGFHVDTDQGPHNQLAIAADPHRFLVVWTSLLSRFPDARGRVLGRFFSWDNPAIPSEPFEISDSPGSNPEVVWNGSEYLVLWQREEGYPSYAEKGVLYGRRIRSDGTVLDLNDVLLVDNVTGQREPSVAWNGRAYLLTYSRGVVCTKIGCTDQLDLYGTLLDADLQFLKRDILISASSFDEISSSVSSDGNGFLVTWGTWATYLGEGGFVVYQDVFAMPIDGLGIPLWAEPRALAATDRLESTPEILWNGTSYVVTWMDPGLKAIQLNRDGTSLLPGIIDVSAIAGRIRAATMIGSGGRTRLIYLRSAPELRHGAAERLFWRDFLVPRRRAAQRR